jgi:hypothetical protein
LPALSARNSSLFFAETPTKFAGTFRLLLLDVKARNHCRTSTTVGDPADVESAWLLALSASPAYLLEVLKFSNTLLHLTAILYRLTIRRRFHVSPNDYQPISWRHLFLWGRVGRTSATDLGSPGPVRHCEPTGRREAPPDDRRRNPLLLSLLPHGLFRFARNDGVEIIP